MNITTLIMIIALYAYWFYNQIITKRVKPRRFIIMPLIFIYFLYKSSSSIDITTLLTPVTFLLVAIGIISGIATGFLTKLFYGDDGALYQKGGLTTALILVGIMVLKVILKYSLAHMPAYHAILSGSFLTLLVLVIQFFTKTIVIFIRHPEVFTSLKNR